ncbi:MAG: diaminopimelate epimerase [Proteobacteria bacterium]|nr:diaminopimelate epimerase [Pseudomonadota bacterium]
MREQIDFIKMNAAGNDFIIIDNRSDQYLLNEAKIAKIANRKNIGCDQLIVLLPCQEADILMDIYNTDGSKSGACGNATRCVASLIMEEKECDDISIKTTANILYCRKEGDLIAVNMGNPRLNWQDIPLLEDINTESFRMPDARLRNYDFGAVNMGNPHAITFINEPISDEEFFHIGPLVENHQLFPEKTNVEFARIIAPDHIEVRVWERGVGETLSCGSGACAVAVMAMRKGLTTQRKVRISFKGGDLFIEWASDGSVIMSGGYNKVFSGTISKEFL